MSRENRPIVIEREGGSSLWWFLIGGTLGAGLALLFAPQSGDRTRRVVGRKLRKLRDAADDTLTDIREALSPEEAVHRSLGDADETEDEGDEELLDEDAEDLAEATARPRRRPVSARMELEQRLVAARARRQRALIDEDEEPVA